MRCKSPPPWWTDQLSWPFHKSLTINIPYRSVQATGNINSLKAGPILWQNAVAWFALHSHTPMSGLARCNPPQPHARTRSTPCSSSGVLTSPACLTLPASPCAGGVAEPTAASSPASWPGVFLAMFPFTSRRRSTIWSAWSDVSLTIAASRLPCTHGRFYGVPEVTETRLSATRFGQSQAHYATTSAKEPPGGVRTRKSTCDRGWLFRSRHVTYPAH